MGKTQLIHDHGFGEMVWSFMFLNNHVAMQQTQENSYQVIIHSDYLVIACSASYRRWGRKKKGRKKKKGKPLKITTDNNKFQEGQILSFLLLLHITASYSPTQMRDTIPNCPLSKETAD